MDGKVAVRGLPNDVIIETEPRPSASRCVDGRAERYNSPGCRPIPRSRVPGFQPVRGILEDEIDHHAEVTLPGKFKELLEFAGVNLAGIRLHPAPACPHLDHGQTRLSDAIEISRPIRLGRIGRPVVLGADDNVHWYTSW
jgi:hypothetical protein